MNLNIQIMIKFTDLIDYGVLACIVEYIKNEV